MIYNYSNYKIKEISVRGFYEKVIIFPLCMFLVFSFVLASCSPVENTSKKIPTILILIYFVCTNSADNPPQSTKSTDTASFIDTASTDYNTTKAGDNSTQNSNSSSKIQLIIQLIKTITKLTHLQNPLVQMKTSTTKNTTKSTSNTTTEKPQQNDGKISSR